MMTYTLKAGEYAIELHSPEFENVDEAWALQHTFAQSSKMRAHRIRHTESGQLTYAVSCLVGILPNGSNGGENEAGIKRLKSIFRTIDKAGDAIELQPNNPNHTVSTVQELRDRYGI